jgi:nicotinate-nucleotide adenylyltransferase
MAAATVGLLGGTFDPVHRAHLLLAREARERFGLGQVLFVPARQPPHKEDESITPARHRLAMLRLALADEPQTGITEVELQRAGPSYTVQTLRDLEAAHPEREYRIIIGGDQVGILHQWHRAREVIRRGRPVIATRPGTDLAPGEAREGRAAALRAALDPALHDLAGVLAEGVFELPPLDLSSTEVRRRAAAGEPLEPLVPPAVARYIREHQLYRNGDPRAAC